MAQTQDEEEDHVLLPEGTKATLIGGFKIDKYIKQLDSPEKPRGLINYGNTCFCNTALQMLLSSSYFIRALRGTYELRNNTVDPNPDFIDVILALFNQTNTTDSDDRANQKLMWDFVSSLKDDYSSGQQQDCHECIITLIDWLERMERVPEDLTRKQRKISLGKDHQEVMRSFGVYWWNELTYRMDRKENSIAKKFHGLYHNSSTCKVCKRENNQWSLFSNITITTYANTFIDWLKDFSKEEELEGYECDCCKKKQTAIRKMEIWRFPDIFILHSVMKTMNNLKTEFEVDEPERGRTKFILKSIGFHSGATINSGHYYCAVKYCDKWWMISDESVQGPINPIKTLPPHVNDTYLLLYERVQ
ncbi:MAG: hypothetical protein CMM25_08030 [Rhodospirillaceae bacterium]|nr:hypothetical protein [Rhodospirillaceae bacterium]|tara:strand:+ start:1558 stop:2640 length:1083 start_codon:yes stop_codon:yes gene_type:complete